MKRVVIESCCAVVRGSTFLSIAVLLIATATFSASTTLLVFGLYVVVRRGLDSTMRFCPLALFLSYPSRIARKIFLSESGYPPIKGWTGWNQGFYIVSLRRITNNRNFSRFQPTSAMRQRIYSLALLILTILSNETKLITQIFGLKSVMDKGLVNK